MNSKKAMTPPTAPLPAPKSPAPAEASCVFFKRLSSEEALRIMGIKVACLRPGDTRIHPHADTMIPHWHQEDFWMGKAHGRLAGSAQAGGGADGPGAPREQSAMPDIPNRAYRAEERTIKRQKRPRCPWQGESGGPCAADFSQVGSGRGHRVPPCD